uniref:Uncharacterized protein n=1 Tax=Salix viminalis TaxID=40686 RepID=A0A6N2JY61_SALVM
MIDDRRLDRPRNSNFFISITESVFNTWVFSCYDVIFQAMLVVVHTSVSVLTWHYWHLVMLVPVI